MEIDVLDAFEQLDDRLMSYKPQVEEITLDLARYWPQLCQYLSIDIAESFEKHSCISFKVLRLDQLHPLISGNKWPKLRGWLAHILQTRQKPSLLTSMGGAHSNHLVAFAAALQELDIPCRCFVRANGHDDELIPTETIILLKALGAEVVPVSRGEFRKLRDYKDAAFCPEGGRSTESVSSIMDWASSHLEVFYGVQTLYTGVGTGTWLSGLSMALGLNSSTMGCRVFGVPAVAGKKWLAQDIWSLQKAYALKGGVSDVDNWTLDWRYPQKGFGPAAEGYLGWLRDMCPFPIDAVYLPRVLFVLLQRYIRGEQESAMIVHSGGLRP